MKSYINKLFAGFSFLFTAASGFSQIPVTDLAHITQSIQAQVATEASWVSQYAQMIQQYQNQMTQIKAITGNRGMGALMPNMTRQALPSDFLSSFDSLRSGSASSGATAIYNTIKKFDCTQQFPTDQDSRLSCQALALSAPQHADMINTGIIAAKVRQDELKNLLNSVDSTTDAKGAADLQNRIQAEVALLNNEKQMMGMASELHKQQLEITRQQISESGAKRMSRGADSVNPFSLK